MINPYEELGLPSDASEEDIKNAYRNKAKKHHPDKGGSKSKFALISAAYDILKDSKKRSYYDNYGAEKPSYTANEQLAVSIFNQLVEGILDVDADVILYKDIISEMNNFVEVKKNMVEQLRSRSKVSLNNINKIKKIFKKRLKHKKKKAKTNLFIAVVDARIKKYEAHIQQMNNEEEIYKIVSDMINDFNFKMEAHEYEGS